MAKDKRNQTVIVGFVIGCLVFVTLMNHLKLDNQTTEVKIHFKNVKPTQISTQDSIQIDTLHLEYSRNETPEEVRVQKLNRKPLILYWNEYFSDEFDHFVAKESSGIKCPYECVHTADRKHGAEADIRVFHERNFDPENLPPNNPSALNIYYTLEPPYLTYSKYNRQTQAPLNYFNYTGSYRSRSMIYYPYDTFVPIDGTEKKEDFWTDSEIEEKMSKKQKPVLIAMSNCGADSKRHEYVRELRKHIQVSQVGGCDGNVVCAKDPDGRALRVDMDCMHKLNDEHYFYLSFENSVCPEYTSEKFWRMKQLIVPVVLSRGAMPLHVPKDVYIAVSDFESPKHLADFLTQLMQNKDEYRKYFNWAKLYRKTRITEQEIAVSCQLCKLAHRQLKHEIKDYKDHWGRRECIRDYADYLMNNLPDNINSAKCPEQRLSKLVKETYAKRQIGKIV